jgi:hypothetical protein
MLVVNNLAAIALWIYFLLEQSEPVMVIITIMFLAFSLAPFFVVAISQSNNANQCNQNTNNSPSPPLAASGFAFRGNKDKGKYPDDE